MDDISTLTNRELRQRLIERGLTPGPVLATTRVVYENQLRQALGRAPAGPEAVPQQRRSPVRRTTKRRVHTSSPKLSDHLVTSTPVHKLYDSISSSSDESTYEGEEYFRVVPDSDTESDMQVRSREIFKTMSTQQHDAAAYPKATPRNYIFKTPQVPSRLSVYDRKPMGYVSGAFVAPTQSRTSIFRLITKAILFLFVVIFVYMLVLRLSEMDVGQRDELEKPKE